MDEVDTRLLGLINEPLSRCGVDGACRAAWRLIRAVTSATEAPEAYEDEC